VNAERAATLGDVDQPGDEVGQFPGHGRELVDHQQQPREWRQHVSTARAFVQVVEDVLGAGRGQLGLPAAQFGAERDQRALHQVGVEVGDQADGVRQVGALGEGTAALVVDQHEGHLVRPVDHRQRRHQGL
jgi:hypothetical protein